MMGLQTYRLFLISFQSKSASCRFGGGSCIYFGLHPLLTGRGILKKEYKQKSDHLSSAGDSKKVGKSYQSKTGEFFWVYV